MNAVFKKELRLYLTSMSGYVFLSFFVFITALYFVLINISQGYTDYQYVLSDTTIMFLIIIPLLTMRLFSEEAKNKSDQLIFTSPMSISQIVLGKYFAALFLFFIALLITIVFPIALSFFGNIPSAQIIGTYIGHLILAACFISVGLFISSLSENQIVVAISSFATIFLFFILDSITTTLPTNKIASSIFILALIFALSLYVFRQTKDRVMSVVCFIVFILGLILSFIFNLNILDSTMYKVLGWFSLLSRFNNFGNGVLSVSDIIYYFSFIILFLYLTINKLECRRY